MPRAHTNIAGRARERGQTMILVVFAMLALLGMAALAIDVTTLYVARHEAQQAADAAALAGAKTFVTSGFTSGYVTTTTAQTLASNAAQAAGQQLSISGSPITSSEITVASGTNQANPYVKVTIARTTLQTYFARIWGVSTTGVRASATAEAYNPSGQNAPIQLSAVKPWLLPNCVPSTSTTPNANCGDPSQVYYIKPTDGSIAHNGSFIGAPTLLSMAVVPAGPLNSGCSSGSTSCGNFYPLSIPIYPTSAVPPPVCAQASTPPYGCDQIGSGPYFDNTACSNIGFQFSCGQQIVASPGSPSQVWVDNRITNGVSLGLLRQRTDEGVACLIHERTLGSPNNGQDVFTFPGSPYTPLIAPGSLNPDPNLAGASAISRSDSIVTVPLFDGRDMCPGGMGANCTGTATVVGFLQLAITQDTSNTANGTFSAYILNASGCNPTPSGPAVTGSTLSSIPVRLIQAP